MEGVAQEYQTVYKENAKCFTPGLEPSQVIGNYSNWSRNYDKMMCLGTYNGPLMGAEEVARLVPEERRQKVRVLDIAAGTGKVGLELHKRGFVNIDALEPSEGMMNILRDTGVYSVKYQEFLGIGQNTVPPDTYDVVVIVGGMGEGHVPIQGVDDMIRITKPGGFVVIVMRLEYLEVVKEYKNRLEPHMDLLQQQGWWRKETKKVVRNYAFGKDGVIFICRVL
ncbi:methyltransferase-like protein 27 [Panulirus ornatus]|uniref:methyltransferase-like protein 27 n=1 Tax=Panulirus ornatus TaxID=150431 RepID=UPI003A84BB34